MGLPLRILLLAPLAAAFLVIPANWAQSEQPTQAVKPPFSIRISLAQDVVKPGSEIRLDVVLTNTANENIVIAQCGRPNYQIEVFDSHGKPLPKLKDCVPRESPDHPGWTSLCPGDVTTASPLIICAPQNQVLKSMRPHEILKAEMVVNELYDLSQPGKYTVHVQLVNEPRTLLTVPGKFGYSQDIELDDKTNDTSRATAKSNAVTLTIESTPQPSP